MDGNDYVIGLLEYHSSYNLDVWITDTNVSRETQFQEQCHIIGKMLRGCSCVVCVMFLENCNTWGNLFLSCGRFVLFAHTVFH